MLRINDSASVNSSYFDITRPTMVLVHGFLESSNFASIVEFREGSYMRDEKNPRDSAGLKFYSWRNYAYPPPSPRATC